MNPSIQLNPVKSSQIAAIGYDAASKTLAIEFYGFKDRKTGDQKPNSIYRYNEFPPEEWEKFNSAESPGSHFHNYIKGQYGHQRHI